VSVSFKQQSAHLPAIRADMPEHGRWSATAQQQVLRRLDKTFRAFFRRGYGFPRFRAKSRFHAAEMRVGNGLTLPKSGKLGIVGVPGELRVRWHRPLPSKPASAIVTRQNGKWCVIFHVEVPIEPRGGRGTSVGLDLGLPQLAALTSGDPILRPNWTKRALREQRRRQRAIARCKRGSKTCAKRLHQLAKMHERVANRRRNHLHQVSHDLVKQYDRIAIEDLKVTPMLATRPYLARDIHDAAWTTLTALLDYKAERAGIELVKVDPSHTSSTCPGCNAVAAKPLHQRTHRCGCGFVGDRHVVAAMVVHHRAFGCWPGAGQGSPSLDCSRA
jgi:putative transposase